MKQNKKRNPVLFQGRKKKDYYFEGWYYKVVSSDEQTTFAFIPGVSLYEDDTHAFIQVFISSKNPEDILLTEYIRFPYEDFSYQDKPFQITIGDNTFSLEKVALNLATEMISLEGALSIEKITPLKSSIYAPNIMGPFAYVPKMECFHGIVSMSHDINGQIIFNNQKIMFNQAKGYIEKDWGTSFPKEYVWMQSNHFKNKNTSFMFSYASIPFLGLTFDGLISVLYHNKKEYRFSTYQFAKVKKEQLTETEAYYEIKQGKLLLTLHALTDKGISLQSPKNGQMKDTIKEGLSGKISIKLYYKGQLILDDTGLHAGIEIMKA